MTDNEIIKALECCVNAEPCENCPYQKQCDETDLAEIALDLIKRKDEQIESLISGQETLQKYIAEKDAEIERLKGRLESSDKQLETMKEGNGRLYLRFNTARNKGIKEFAERFLKKIHENHYLLSDKHNSTDKGMFTIGIEQAVNETKIEMVGETE